MTYIYSFTIHQSRDIYGCKVARIEVDIRSASDHTSIFVINRPYDHVASKLLDSVMNDLCVSCSYVITTCIFLKKTDIRPQSI